MARLTSSQFMRELPGAVRPHLPAGLRSFKSVTRGWLCQLYYADPRLHYEVWNMGERRGILEVGLHFESRDRALNARLLEGFSRRMVEVKATLGPQWEAEMWDKGWAKVYATLPYQAFSNEWVEEVAGDLARAMRLLTPMLEDLSPGGRRQGTRGRITRAT